MRPRGRLTPEQIENIEEFILESITGTANEWVGQGRQREADFVYGISNIATSVLEFAKK
jgi:hypothetical protein